MALRLDVPPKVVPGAEPGQAKKRRDKPGSWKLALKRDWRLYTLLALPLLYLLIFRYLPMAGNVIAFRQFQPGGSIFGEKWVGFKYITLFINDPSFWQAFQNTIILGVLTLVFCFPMPIIFALMLNELRSQKFKKFVQTVAYLPHFMSVVIIAGMILQNFSMTGTVNQIAETLFGTTVNFTQDPGWFRPMYISSEVWQTMGWGAILYLAALTRVDESLYEAARIDGANRWQQTWHVTLPAIRPTIITLLILNIGTFMAVGFEKILLIYNPLNYATSDVISTYLYRVGLESSNFSYAAAIGMFESVIGLTLILSANAISKRVAGTSLW
ncbi:MULTISPECIES: ABC transporter permease subunit [Micrococcaceae]|jgi:putative aldouronate transport system permease protein|uniref:Transmembrane lipoprotein LplB n=1 Tax=Paenarthrobacter aurescens (strain TC1) TaxID=290340 RepID=A1R3V4_PAEAT|nr:MULTISPECIES: ABC transporter permease subunit [Micrococcaceae]ABM09132.1 putative transmembrane lipoprotein LplB [Paenarthrobacter aurescens TC1]AFR28001.1 protein LplB [Arthrobacter sp. Rue61a]MBP2267081.1 putative aldouronate transport system permease protein [Pseudarthrobacter sp. PvP004]